MRQCSMPSRWAATWASIETSALAVAIGAMAGGGAVGLGRRDRVGERGGDAVQHVHAGLPEAGVALLGEQVDDAQHRQVGLPEVEEAVDQLASALA